MKVQITTLKAPWPEGAKVGDIVSFKGDTAPAWAVGKFKHVEDDVKADHRYVAPEPELVAGPASSTVGAINAEILDLQGKLTAADEALAKSLDAVKAEKDRADDLQGKLTAAEQALATAKAGKK